MSFVSKAKHFVDRLKGFNYDDPRYNGEYNFIRNNIKQWKVVFDVGGHIGNYSNYVLTAKPTIQLHTFEPWRGNFQIIKERLSNLHLNNAGLSDQPGELEMNIYWDDGGVNSFYLDEHYKEMSEARGQFRIEKVQLTTIDEYVKANNISQIDMLKIDVEGHETKVLNGAANFIHAGKIRNIQFEYGNFWKLSNSTLKYVFDMLIANHFTIYRLSPFGKIPVHYKPELENYKQCNYLAVLS